MYAYFPEQIYPDRKHVIPSSNHAQRKRKRVSNHFHHTLQGKVKMEDIATDDDLLSDMLLDSLEFEPKISTHKMNQAYRSPRYKTQQIIDIVRQKIVIDADLSGAVDTLCSIDVIRKHLSTKSSRQRYEFQQHAKRYLEAYMPESGVEFALTTRYKRASRLTSSSAETSKAGQEHAEAEARALAAGKAASQSSVARGKLKAESGESLGTSMADLCVVATKPFKIGRAHV